MRGLIIVQVEKNPFNSTKALTQWGLGRQPRPGDNTSIQSRAGPNILTFTFFRYLFCKSQIQVPRATNAPRQTAQELLFQKPTSPGLPFVSFLNQRTLKTKWFLILSCYVWSYTSSLPYGAENCHSRIINHLLTPSITHLKYLSFIIFLNCLLYVCCILEAKELALSLYQTNPSFKNESLLS